VDTVRKGIPVIELSDISFKYKGGAESTGLSDINLTIGDGECVLLCGESGCGKTTLTRLINGLIPHYYEGSLAGKVRVKGRDIAARPLYETAGLIGSVFQNPRSQFFNVDTTSEIAFGCENLGMPEEEILRRVETAAAAMNIEYLMGRSIFALSVGEKQKIACTSVFALDPAVLVLDEPSSNLDMNSIGDLRRQIAFWKGQGRTIVIAEHRLHYLAGLADRIIYLRQGSIVREYTWAALETLPPEERDSLGMRSLDLRRINPGRADSGGPPADLTTEDQNRIGLNNFHFVYKRGQAVLDIPSLTLPKSGIIAVIGRNGAGKSTLARCLCGLEKGCPGIMETAGKRYKAGSRLKRCYLVMQDVNHQLFTESVLDEVLISMEKPDTAEAERILESLDLLPLKDLHPMSLSGGQKQRTAIASALASRRELLIFDEPTSGQDLRHIGRTADMLREFQRLGKTILVITHDLELIFAACTHTVCMEKGKAAAAYPLDDEGKRRTLDFFTGAGRYADVHT
jgi:energy-coupling factor transport system ATP-binding protein